MAEHLGLRAQVVATPASPACSTTSGLTTLPTGLVRSTGVVGGSRAAELPRARGAGCCRASASCPGRSTPSPTTARRVSPRRRAGPERRRPCVVGLADEYDLLTEVGTPDGAVLTQEEARGPAPRTPAGREDLLRALEQALSRRAGGAA